MNLCFDAKDKSMTYENLSLSPFTLLTNFGASHSCETGICINQMVEKNVFLFAIPNN